MTDIVQCGRCGIEPDGPIEKNKRDYFYMECPCCGISVGPWLSRERCIHEWNRVHLLIAKGKLVEAMESGNGKGARL